MARKQQAPPSPELQQTQQQFQAWRQNKTPCERIPEPLWQRAVELVPALGLNQVVRELRLDYYSLKKRVQPAAGNSETPAANNQPVFVELPQVGGAVRECVMECDPAGNLRVRLTGYQASEIVVVSRSLREKS